MILIESLIFDHFCQINESLRWAVTLIFSISCAESVLSLTTANLLHSGSLQLCSQNNWLLFLPLKKGVFIFVSDVELQSHFKVFFINLSELLMDGWPTTCM